MKDLPDVELRCVVGDVKRDIDTSSEEVKDELLTELLIKTHPLRLSQDN